jgi:hypothetical protein
MEGSDLFIEFIDSVRAYKRERKSPDNRFDDFHFYAHQALLAGEAYVAAGGTNPEALKHLAYLQICYRANYVGAQADVKERAIELLRIASDGGDEEAKQMLCSLQNSNGRYLCNGVNYIESKVGDDFVTKQPCSNRSHAEVEIEYCRRRLGMDLRPAGAADTTKKQRM